MRDHALGEQGVEGLDRLGGQMAGGMHRAGEKARVKQVQNRMFDAADILIDIHPIGGFGSIGGGFGMGRGKAGEIPRTVHEGVHGVRLAPRRGTAGRTGAVAPGGMAVQRVARNVEGDVIGQLDRQVFLFLGHHAAGVAMHHGNRAPPIALTRNPPVAQTVIGDTAPDAHRFALRDGGDDGLIPGLQILAGETADIAHGFGFHRHESFGQRGVFGPLGNENRRYGQPVFRREFKIALVMRRAPENRAGAIVHQHEIRDIDRQFP